VIADEPFPFKTLGLWILFICSGLATAYVFFICLISVWVGLSQRQQDGFWMPVLVGSITIIAILWLFFRLSKFILGRMKEKDVIDM